MLRFSTSFFFPAASSSGSSMVSRFSTQSATPVLQSVFLNRTTTSAATTIVPGLQLSLRGHYSKFRYGFGDKHTKMSRKPRVGVVPKIINRKKKYEKRTGVSRMMKGGS